MPIRVKSLCIWLLSAGLTVFASSLMGSPDAHYNHAQGTDFSKYHTYKWISIAGDVQSSAAVDRAVHQAVERDLAAKGLIRTDGDKADLCVAYQYSVDGDRQWSAFSVGGYQWGIGSAGTTLPTLWIQNGTLVVDMYDPTLKELVWTGQVPKTLNSHSSEGKEIGRVNNGVKELLKDFPPQFKEPKHASTFD
jgi:Domain of unknown function (DUF4136)